MTRQMENLKRKEFLVGNLCFLYRLVVASAPLLDYALDYSFGDEDLRSYYAKHLEEEVGHDLMLEADLKGLGVTNIPRSHTAAAIAGSQYYLISHDSAVALLGYMLVLERGPLEIAEVDELESHYGVKLSALRHHAEHDPAHAAELAAFIDRLGPKEKELVTWNAQAVNLMLVAVANRLEQGIEVI